MIKENGPFIFTPLTSQKMRQYFFLALLPIVFYSSIRYGHLLKLSSTFLLGIITQIVLLTVYTKLSHQTFDKIKNQIAPLTTTLLMYLLIPPTLPVWAICFTTSLYLLFQFLYLKYHLNRLTPFFLSLILSLLFFGKIGYSIQEMLVIPNSSWLMNFMFYIFPCLLGFSFLIFTKSIKWKISVISLITVMLLGTITLLVKHQVLSEGLIKILTSPILLFLCFLAPDMERTPVSGVGCVLYGVVLGMTIVLVSPYFLNVHSVYYLLWLLPILTPFCDYIGSSSAPAWKKVAIPFTVFLFIFIIKLL